MISLTNPQWPQFIIIIVDKKYKYRIPKAFLWLALGYGTFYCIIYSTFFCFYPFVFQMGESLIFGTFYNNETVFYAPKYRIAIFSSSSVRCKLRAALFFSLQCVFITFPLRRVLRRRCWLQQRRITFLEEKGVHRIITFKRLLCKRCFFCVCLSSIFR